MRMIIYLSGAHGVGKTTMVNRINAEATLVKVTNIDYSRKLKTGANFENQLVRFKTYFGIMNKLVRNPDSIIIVDRAPESMKIYTRTHYLMGLMSKEEYEELMKRFEREIHRYNWLVRRYGHKEVRIYLRADESFIMENIRARARDKALKEDDTDYLRRVISEYENFFSDSNGKLIINLEGDKKEAYDRAESVIEDLINQHI